jgi:hypothetical protein
MAAPMPTRRPKRPDGQFYRLTRRQRLSSGSGSGGGASLSVALVAAAVFLPSAAAGFYYRHIGHGGFLTALMAYGSLLLFFLTTGASILRR